MYCGQRCQTECLMSVVSRMKCYRNESTRRIFPNAGIANASSFGRRKAEAVSWHVPDIEMHFILTETFDYRLFVCLFCGYMTSWLTNGIIQFTCMQCTKKPQIHDDFANYQLHGFRSIRCVRQTLFGQQLTKNDESIALQSTQKNNTLINLIGQQFLGSFETEISTRAGESNFSSCNQFEAWKQWF